MNRQGSSLRAGLVLSILVVALAGCASAPVQEMSDARQAISAARAAGGERYTPETLEEAERLINRASHELSLGRYNLARSAALSAKQRAMSAREAALAVQTSTE